MCSLSLLFTEASKVAFDSLMCHMCIWKWFAGTFPVGPRGPFLPFRFINLRGLRVVSRSHNRFRNWQEQPAISVREGREGGKEKARLVSKLSFDTLLLCKFWVGVACQSTYTSRPTIPFPTSRVTILCSCVRVTLDLIGEFPISFCRLYTMPWLSCE